MFVTFNSIQTTMQYVITKLWNVQVIKNITLLQIGYDKNRMYYRYIASENSVYYHTKLTFDKLQPKQILLFSKF